MMSFSFFSKAMFQNGKYFIISFRNMLSEYADVLLFV